MTATWDPEIIAALELAVGHPAPISDDELARVTHLHVTYARDLRGLDRLPALTLLILTGCDPVPVDKLAGLTGVDSLIINDSGLSSLDGLVGPPLIQLNVAQNLLVDLTPMLALTELIDVNVVGNPLSTASYETVLPALCDRGVMVACSEPADWRRAVRMREAGLPFSCYRDGGRLRLNSPGLSQATMPNFGHPVVTEEEIDGLLDTDPAGLYGVFARRDDPGSVH